MGSGTPAAGTRGHPVWEDWWTKNGARPQRKPLGCPASSAAGQASFRSHLAGALVPRSSLALRTLGGMSLFPCSLVLRPVISGLSPLHLESYSFIQTACHRALR